MAAPKWDLMKSHNPMGGRGDSPKGCRQSASLEPCCSRRERVTGRNKEHRALNSSGRVQRLPQLSPVIPSVPSCGAASWPRDIPVHILTGAIHRC